MFKSDYICKIKTEISTFEYNYYVILIEMRQILIKCYITHVQFQLEVR